MLALTLQRAPSHLGILELQIETFELQLKTMTQVALKFILAHGMDVEEM